MLVAHGVRHTVPRAIVGSEVCRNVVLATYQPSGLGRDTGIFADAYESRNPCALSSNQQRSALLQCCAGNAVQVACFEINVGTGLLDIVPCTLDKLLCMFGFHLNHACFCHERIFPCSENSGIPLIGPIRCLHQSTQH
jgi:hypothetical protein